LIGEHSREAELIVLTLRRGLSITHATIVVNEYRVGQGLSPVSWSTVENWTLRTPSIVKERRGYKKSGSKDQTKTWSEARLNQCRFWKFKLELANTLDLGDSLAAAMGDPLEGHMPWQAEDVCPLYLDGILFVDEKHQKAKLGCNSKNDIRVWRDPVTGNVCIL
jgi:hypothetical protein